MLPMRRSIKFANSLRYSSETVKRSADRAADRSTSGSRFTRTLTFTSTCGVALRFAFRKQQEHWVPRNLLSRERWTSLFSLALLGRRPENLEIESMFIKSISIYSIVTLPNKFLPAMVQRATHKRCRVALGTPWRYSTSACQSAERTSVGPFLPTTRYGTGDRQRMLWEQKLDRALEMLMHGEVVIGPVNKTRSLRRPRTAMCRAGYFFGSPPITCAAAAEIPSSAV